MQRIAHFLSTQGTDPTKEECQTVLLRGSLGAQALTGVSKGHVSYCSLDLHYLSVILSTVGQCLYKTGSHNINAYYKRDSLDWLTQ